MSNNNFLSEVQQKEYASLSSKRGNIEEKINFWKKLITSFDSKENWKNLHKLWLELFNKDPLPIAWVPDENLIKDSNIGRLLSDRKLSDYNELYHWSINNREKFWETTINHLGIKFNNPFSNVLDLSKGIEDPIWLEGAKVNIVESCFMQRDNVPAIIQGSEDAVIRKISYKELHALVNKIASGLVNAGLKPGDSIVMYLPLTIESIAAYLAIVKAGMSVVSVADSFSPAELKKRIAITNAKAIITCDGYLYGGKTIDVFSKVKEADAPMAIIAEYAGQRALREGKKDIRFEDILKDEVFPFYYTDPSETTNILFSSGTTKEPKAIPWTHITPIKCASDGYYHQNIKDGDVVTWTTGMGWMMAPWLIYATLINKATIAIFTGAATTEAFGRFVNDAGITILGTIPSVVKAWKSQEFHKKFNWNNIKVFSSTGEPSNQEDYFYLMSLSRFNAPIIEYCGGTEIGGGYITGTIIQPASPATFTTPALGSAFYLLNEKQEVAEKGHPGEVFIVPPTIGLTQKLLNKDHHEEYYANMPKGPKGEVLRKHGDAFETVFELNTTFYKSTGRVDDAMNLGGIKVSAIEIEMVLNRHPSIIETAAISVPGEGGGPEKLIVFFQPKESLNEKEVLKKELQNFLTKELNPLFRISEILERKTLPRTASNKLMRRELRKEYIEQKK